MPRHEGQIRHVLTIVFAIRGKRPRVITVARGAMGGEPCIAPPSRVAHPCKMISVGGSYQIGRKRCAQNLLDGKGTSGSRSIGVPWGSRRETDRETRRAQDEETAIQKNSIHRFPKCSRAAANLRFIAASPAGNQLPTDLRTLLDDPVFLQYLHDPFYRQSLHRMPVPCHGCRLEHGVVYGFFRRFDRC